jgi:hypothetical protein
MHDELFVFLYGLNSDTIWFFSEKRTQGQEKVAAHCDEQSLAVLHCRRVGHQPHVVDLGARAWWI